MFLPEINSKNSDWLMKSAPYIHTGFNSSFFIEYLDQLKDKNKDPADTAKHLGEVYLKILEGYTPDHEKEHVESIVKFLYKYGQKTIADEICNTYGARGLEFLRYLWEENNK